MVLPWIEQYTPKTLSEVVGQQNTTLLKHFVTHYKKGKALLLHGPTGTGKTVSVHALAHDLNLELIEVNASDVRNKANLTSLLSGALGQQSLFSKGKLILLDEIDGLSGTKDRGGIPTIISFIEKSFFPIILTVNDAFDRKYSALRKKTVLVEYHKLPSQIIITILESICKKEKLTCDESTLRRLARSVDGDVRAAINDLQVLAAQDFTKESIDLLGMRTRTQSMKTALHTVFKLSEPEIVRHAYDNVNEDLDKIFLWVDENLPKEYQNSDLTKGFAMLSKADVFFGRIRRWQYYRFYVYCYEALSTGVALAKTKKNPKEIGYAPTTRLLKYWMAKQKHMKKSAIAEKLAAAMHTSKKRVIKDVLPTLLTFFKNSKKASLAKIAEDLNLSSEELIWLCQ